MKYKARFSESGGTAWVQLADGEAYKDDVCSCYGPTAEADAAHIAAVMNRDVVMAAILEAESAALELTLIEAFIMRNKESILDYLADKTERVL